MEKYEGKFLVFEIEKKGSWVRKVFASRAAIKDMRAFIRTIDRILYVPIKALIEADESAFDSPFMKVANKHLKSFFSNGGRIVIECELELETRRMTFKTKLIEDASMDEAHAFACVNKMLTRLLQDFGIKPEIPAESTTYDPK